MAYQNFIPTVWAETINRELERNHVFVADTNKQYEGQVKEKGDSVRILGIGKPTITTQTGKKITLPDPEEIPDQSITMPINKVAYFNYKVDDIDKRQAVGGLMEALSKETSEGLANEQDLCVSNLAKDPKAVVHNTTATQITESNVLSFIDDMLEKLFDNDVKPESKITLTIPPWFYMILKRAYTELDTDNSDILKNGKVGRYGSAIIKMSNNVAKDTAGNHLIQLKTDRAIAFANPMTHIEPYRPEKSFSDAVKGFILYDAMIVRPKEMIIGKVKKTA